MKASVVPATTVPWKWPGTYSVLCIMMFSCSVPSTTPEMPPMTPNMTSDRNMPEKAGLSGRLAQPFEHAIGEAVPALGGLDGAGHGHAVDHRAHDREIHHVGG